jgi:hypothetical protein
MATELFIGNESRYLKRRYKIAVQLDATNKTTFDLIDGSRVRAMAVPDMGTNVQRM